MELFVHSKSDEFQPDQNNPQKLVDFVDGSATITSVTGPLFEEFTPLQWRHNGHDG